MKSAPQQVTFSGNFTYTLTPSYVNSDVLRCDFDEAITVYPFYSAGSGETSNTVSIQVQTNPLISEEDTGNLYWANAGGQYTNSSGTWTEEDATYTVSQGDAGTYEPGQPIVLGNMHAQQMRIKVKENGVATNAGSLRLIIVREANLRV